MSFLMNTLAIAWKELQVLFKDRGQLAVLFLMPLLIGTLVSAGNAAAWSQEDEEGGGAPGTITLPVYVVNEDRGPYGEEVVKVLEEIDMLRAVSMASSEEADQKVAEGEKLAAIIIPPDFSEDVDGYEPTEVEVIVDPAQQQFGSIVAGLVNYAVVPATLRGEIQHGIQTVLDESGVLDGADPELRRAATAQSLGVIMTQMQEMSENPPIAVVSEDLEGMEAKPPPNAFSLFMPGFTMMFAFFIITFIPNTIFTEKEEGSFRRLLAAPVHRGSIIAGKMLAYVWVVCLQVLLMFGVAGGFFGMPLGDSPVSLALITLAVASAATSLGMLLAALSRTRQQADSLGMLLVFVLAFVGGCIPLGTITPLYRQDWFMAKLSLLTPHAHALEGYFRVMNEGSGLVQVLPQIGVLAGMGVVFFLIATWRFRFE